jgi:hypothetical protein
MSQYSKITTVRIEIEPTTDISLAASWIASAQSAGYSVIATYHKATVLGSDSTTELDAAASWWVTYYGTLSASGALTINMMNEWGSHVITSNAYASAYNSAISTVRQVYSGTIIIDIPGWGQETVTAKDAVLGTNGVAITDTNIMLSMHAYPNGYNTGAGHYIQASDLDDLAATGRCVIIGEFGNVPSGSGDWSGVVTSATSRGWPVIGWAWNGDGLGMNMASPAWVSNPTATSYSTSNYFNTVYDLL